MDNQVQTIKTLLSKVSDIRIKYEKIEEITGENFNVFKILNLSSNEVRTHSAFICEFLNTKGSHGYKEVFLKLFLEQLRKKFSEQNQFLRRFADFEISSSITSTEEHLGFIDNEGTEGGKIDLLIIDVKNRAIIIENKIYARDQPKQLVRYNNAFKEAPIFYLTLDESFPTVNSSGELINGEHFVCISYKKDIIEWLEKCRKEAVLHSLLRETISQYINLIKYLTGQTMNKEQKKDIVNSIVGNHDNLESFFEIQQSDILTEVKTELMKMFREQITELAAKYELILVWDKKFNFGGESDIELTLKSESKYGYYISFGFLWSYEKLSYGIISKQPYKEGHREIVLSKKGSGSINFKKKEFINWLWMDKFESPLDNWKIYHPWLAIKNGSLKDSMDKKIEDLLKIIKALENNETFFT